MKAILILSALVSIILLGLSIYHGIIMSLIDFLGIFGNNDFGPQIGQILKDLLKGGLFFLLARATASVYFNLNERL